MSVDRRSVCTTGVAWSTRRCRLEQRKSSEEPWHSLYSRP